MEIIGTRIVSMVTASLIYLICVRLLKENEVTAPGSGREYKALKGAFFLLIRSARLKVRSHGAILCECDCDF